MEIKIYADIIFLINWMMDFFILWIVAKIMKKPVSSSRILIGAALGAALHAAILFLPYLHRTYNILGFLALAMIMIMATFQPKGFKEFLKLLFTLHIIAFGLGGTAIALFYYTNLGLILSQSFTQGIQNFPVHILFFATLISYVFLKVGYYWISRHLKNKSYYLIRIYFNGHQVDANALVDTGNNLYDPLTSAPVIIVEFDAVKKILPDSMQFLFLERQESNLERITETLEKSQEACLKIRMIPFSSLGTPNGMLIGFKPDHVEVLAKKEATVSKEVIVGIYNHSLSPDNTYQALLHPDMIAYDIA
ncbi:MAG: sigma-E processing peptidase SpoIIGA [Epulopiscium sp.]|nr:sigma-E processing peptidase SpoIIGA [Candidatus Epulonipiscium sp.]